MRKIFSSSSLVDYSPISSHYHPQYPRRAPNYPPAQVINNSHQLQLQPLYCPSNSAFNYSNILKFITGKQLLIVAPSESILHNHTAALRRYNNSNLSIQFFAVVNNNNINQSKRQYNSSVNIVNDAQYQRSDYQSSRFISAADHESLLCSLQDHLRQMPLSYAQAGFTIEEMLHHIRILNEIESGRRVGLLQMIGKTKQTNCTLPVSMAAEHQKLYSAISTDTEHLSNMLKQRKRKCAMLVHFASDCNGNNNCSNADCTTSNSNNNNYTALDALRLGLGDQVMKVKRIQIYRRANEDWALSIAHVKLQFDQKSSRLIKAGSDHNLSDKIQHHQMSKDTEQCTVNNGCIKNGIIEEVKKPVISASVQSPSSSLCRTDMTEFDEIMKRWSINADEIWLQRKIGEGSSAVVYEGIYRGENVNQSNIRVAVKLIKSSKYEAEFKREVTAMATLSGSSNILPLVGAWVNRNAGDSAESEENSADFDGLIRINDDAEASLADNNEVGLTNDYGGVLKRCWGGLVTKLMEGGTLRSYLEHCGDGLKMKRALEVAMAIAKGMHHLHSRSFVHMDLKSPNIFLDKSDSNDASVYIGDFGSCRTVNSCDSFCTNDAFGTYRWMAPEAFGVEMDMAAHNNNSNMSDNNLALLKAMDVYSFGMVLWELLSDGELPFQGYTPLQAAAAVVMQGLRPPMPSQSRCPPPLACLVRKCWSQDPSQRPSSSQIIRMLQILKSTSRSN